ncbi:MAG: hypothetical protein DRJ52_08865 [Thermoprotei archaeon]|nr:MAG: hypothetical protein DRJ52_08865 [Thermoprotei archaeon]RLE98634.1 MAG: hypothetical protein DRJ63_07420 [Thermoprotei archaeon]
MLTPFCEILSKKILPVMRVLIAKELIEKYNFTQLEAARILGISQPLLNYYLTGKRKVKYFDELSSVPVIVELSKKIAEAIARRELTVDYFCIVCRTLHAHAAEILEKLNIDVNTILIPSKEVK